MVTLATGKRLVIVILTLGLALSAVACAPTAPVTETVTPPPETVYVTVTPPPVTVTVTPASQQPESTLAPSPTPTGIVLSFTAKHLYDEYSANPGLTELFNGQLLRVQGNIYKFYSLGNQYIIMLGVEPVHRVDCVFDAGAAPDERTLSAGKPVLIEGYGAGASVDGDPKLTGCRLIPQ